MKVKRYSLTDGCVKNNDAFLLFFVANFDTDKCYFLALSYQITRDIWLQRFSQGWLVDLQWKPFFDDQITIIHKIPFKDNDKTQSAA